MKKLMFVMSCALTLLIAPPAFAQNATSAVEKTQAIREAAMKEQIQKLEAAVQAQQAQNNPRFVRTLTNVLIELTMTDQTGSGPADKKTVSMTVSSGNWGKIRSAGSVYPGDGPPYGVELNVDARPFVSLEGQVQVELTLVYSPQRSATEAKENARQRPAGINQSQTVILQSGKPLVVSQAADPISDRKVVVEVKATVLK